MVADLSDPWLYLEVNIPGIDNNTSPTCSSTFLYTKLGVIEGGQLTSTTARILLLSPISGVVRTLSGGILPAGFIHDVVRSACKNGLILSIFSIPAILIVQLRSCDNCSTRQVGLETKYGTAPVLTPGPVIAVVVAPVETYLLVMLIIRLLDS
jgi:hypothetical protein